MANTQILKGIRCPECLGEQAFVIQITRNVVMFDDGYEPGLEREDDYFPEHVIEPDAGLRDDDPIECFERRGGCGHRGRVKEFRAHSDAADVQP